MVLPAVVTALGTWLGLGFQDFPIIPNSSFFIGFLFVAFLILFYILLFACRTSSSEMNVKRMYRRRQWAPFLYCYALVLLTVASMFNARLTGFPQSSLPQGSQLKLTLQVCDQSSPYITKSGRTYLRFTARLVTAEDSAGTVLRGKERLQVWVAGGTDSLSVALKDSFPIGQVFSTKARIRPAAQDSSGYAEYLARQRIFRRVFVYRWQRGPLAPTILDKVQLLRMSLASMWVLPDKDDDGYKKALLEGICLGYKAGLDDLTKDAYSAAGASHILAVSGLHVGVIYATWLFLLGWLGRKRAPVAAVLMVWIYAVMVGLSASVVRASLMLTLHALGVLLNRRSYGLNAWATAAFLLLIVKPQNLNDWGFQLSFAAVGSLLLYFPLLRNLLSIRNRLLRFFWEILCCSVAVQIGTLWLQVGLFEAIPVYSLLTNMLVIPLGTAIIYLFVVFLLGYSVAGFFPWLCAKTVLGLLYLAGLLNKLVRYVACLPHAVLSVNSDIYLQVILLWGAAYFYSTLRFRTSKS